MLATSIGDYIGNAFLICDIVSCNSSIVPYLFSVHLCTSSLKNNAPVAYHITLVSRWFRRSGRLQRLKSGDECVHGWDTARDQTASVLGFEFPSIYLPRSRKDSGVPPSGIAPVLRHLEQMKSSFSFEPPFAFEMWVPPIEMLIGDEALSELSESRFKEMTRYLDLFEKEGGSYNSNFIFLMSACRIASGLILLHLTTSLQELRNKARSIWISWGGGRVLAFCSFK